MNMNIWVATATKLYNIKQQRKSIEREEQALEVSLRQLSGDKSIKHDQFNYFYEIRQGNVDYGSIPGLKGINLDAYRKPAVKVWKLVVEVI